ncbi:glycoside hydrolase family 18 [Clostridium sp. CAG:780]|nr:glycoside hydrolase family 18 [Clostridium sp. CAG:780]
MAKEKSFYIYKLIVVLVFALAVWFVLKTATNYIKDDIVGKTNLVINNSNTTKNLKNDVIVENGVVYVSTKDIANFFDDHIFYDNKYDQIITTSETKVATLKLNENKAKVNGSTVDLVASAKKIGEQFYLPFSEISESVYNVETTYIKDTNTVVLVSLDRELTYANSSKKNSVKSNPTMFSKTVDKIEKGDNVTVILSKNGDENGWTKVTTENGKIGYVKTTTLANTKKIRDNLEMGKQIQGNVSLVWEYFSKYAKAPQRTEKIDGVNVVAPTFFSLADSEKGAIVANVGQAGQNYINWAHSNGYRVWPWVANEATNKADKDLTSEILNDYKLREKLINSIVSAVEMYNLDGINLDFENMYESDKDAYSRLVIELAPRLKELGKVLSVDVTAPDGSPDWSLCFNRNVIGDVADYVIFMAYDQHNQSSTEAGTVAGCDWVEANINKFLGQEGVKPEKIILAMPFYTRVWNVTDGGLSSSAVDMKSQSTLIPGDAKITWDDSLKQNLAEYEKNGRTYKVWMEDAKSLKCKLDLVKKYSLAGGAFWRKDQETSDVWKVINENL